MWLSLCLLGEIAWTDGMSHRIPDRTVLLFTLCGLAQGFITNSIGWAIWGGLLIGVPLLVLAVHFSKGIGGGDVKLCTALGVVLGAADGLLVICGGLIFLSLYGILTHAQGKQIPFAPFLFFAYCLYLLI